jgi:hypothetical protein
MLRLLAQREQGYDDIAALMGLSVEQVRTRVKEALAEIDSSEEAVSSPAIAEPVEPPPAPEPAKPEPAKRPAATPPPPAPPAAPRPKASLSLPRLSLPSSRRRLIEWIGGGAIVILIALFATGTINLGGGSGSSTTTATTPPAESGEASTTAAEAKKITKAVLSPVAGGNAKGLALFGQLKRKIVLQVEAVGLDPSPPGSSYTIWLFKSPKLALRVGSAKVVKSGGLAVRLELPEEAFAAVATRVFDQIDISLTSDAAYRAEVARAKKANELPRYTGTDVLRGPITGPVIKKPTG